MITMNSRDHNQFSYHFYATYLGSKTLKLVLPILVAALGGTVIYGYLLLTLILIL